MTRLLMGRCFLFRYCGNPSYNSGSLIPSKNRMVQPNPLNAGYLAQGLQSGDVYVEGSEVYAD
jgi:hypothetical protein